MFNRSKPFRPLLLAGLLVGLSGAWADTLTNVLPVNVTPTSFSILWSGVSATPSIAVYADAAGRTNLSSQLGVEAFPLRTGNPALAAGYDRRQDQVTLQHKTQGLGYALLRVTGCQPGTTYYYRLSHSRPRSVPVLVPPSGALPGVTTEKENSFVVDDQLLVLDVPGFDSYGRIVTLSNANASYCLAGVVGDGAGTNQVFFNTSDLFLLAGGGNFSVPGPQQFTADVLGIYGYPHTRVDFSLNFTTNLTAAVGNQDSMHTDFLTVSLGSVVMQTGHTTNVWVQFASSANLSEVSFLVDLSGNSLTNLAWDSLAAEFDPASATVTPQGPTTCLLHLATRSGQFITGSRQIGQLAFSAIPGQHSAFVAVKPQPLTASRTDTTLVTNLFSQPGRAVVIGPEPLLDAGFALDGTRQLTLYGNPATTYGIDYLTSLASPTTWIRLPTQFPLTTLSAPVQGLEPAASPIFYRAVELPGP
jgi:hypothetical protein